LLKGYAKDVGIKTTTSPQLYAKDVGIKTITSPQLCCRTNLQCNFSFILTRIIWFVSRAASV